MNTTQNTSIYIPHVYINYTKDKLISIFENKLNLGKIKNVDLVAKMGTNGKPYNSVYVYFEYWNDNETTRNLLTDLSEHEPKHLIYDAPWYWIVLKNTHTTKPVLGERKKRIQLEDTSIPNPPPNTPLRQTEVVNLVPTRNTSNSSLTLPDPVNLESYFDEYMPSTMEEMMRTTSDPDVLNFIDSIDNELDSMDPHTFITIDGRYVQELENDYLVAQEYIKWLQWQMSLSYYPYNQVA
jgi:hypothetical protein